MRLLNHMLLANRNKRISRKRYKETYMKNIIKKILSVAFVFSFIGAQTALAYTPGYVSSSASNITSTSATFNATMNPSGLNTNAWFETSTSGQLGYQNIGSGTSNVVMTPYTMSGLIPSTTYTFRVVAIRN